MGKSADGFTPLGLCSAGHCDWRLPTVSELSRIMDCSHGSICVDPIFGPTAYSGYWSPSSYAGAPALAWAVGFGYGSIFTYDEMYLLPVRAVRGGL